MPPLLPCLRPCCAPPPVVAIVAPTFERARWIAFVERGLTRSRWVFVHEPRHLQGASHVVLDELPDGPVGDLIWDELLVLMHATSAVVEGVIS